MSEHMRGIIIHHPNYEEMKKHLNKLGFDPQILSHRFWFFTLLKIVLVPGGSFEQKTVTSVQGTKGQKKQWFTDMNARLNASLHVCHSANMSAGCFSSRMKDQPKERTNEGPTD